MQVKCAHTRIVDIAKLVPNPRNRNVHTDQQIALLAKIMKVQGIRKPIVVSKRSGFMTAGHARLEAAKLNGWTKFPVDDQNYKSEAEEYADMIADNTLHELSKTNLEAVKADLPEINWNLDLDLLGVPDLSWGGASEDEKKEEMKDNVPPAPKVARSKRGQIYRLGEHRLMCGDSTSEADVRLLMGGGKADMVFTDPPYNVDYDPESRASYFSPERLANKLGKIKNDKKSPQDFRAFLDKVYANLDTSLAPGGGIYVCHADTEGHHFRNAFIARAWKLQSCLIWKKTVLVFGRADYHWMHEPILYGWKEGEAHRWFGDRKQTTILEFPTDHYNKKESDTKGYVHPTQKPVALIECAVKNSSKPGDRVLDLFGGSGSTLIACEAQKRRGYAMELDPIYVDVIIKRWEDYTGRKAELIHGPEADKARRPKRAATA